MVKQSIIIIGKPSEKQEAKFKGVRKRKWGKWVSEIRLPNSRERIWLGSYDAPEKAARAFDAALFCLRGNSAKFNFPDNPPEIPGGREFSREEIQVAAAKFANAAAESAHGGSRSDNSSSELLSSDYPSPSSVSDVTVQMELDSELMMMEEGSSSFLDMLTNMGSDCNVVPDYGIFPGFDDLSNDFLALPLPTVVDDIEEINNGDNVGLFSQPSFLWNF